MTRLRIPLTLILCALLSAGLVACGGGGGDEDPQQVLDETFNNEQSIESGQADLQITIDAEGGDAGGNLEAGVSGPFQAADSEGGVPSFDLQANLSGESQGQSLSFSGGITSTGDKAFVNYRETDYEVDPRTFDSIKEIFARIGRQGGGQQDQGGLERFGVNPSDWLTELTNEGNTDVEGTETIEISGQVDVAKFFQDVANIARQAGRAAGGQALSDEQLAQVEESVKEADFSVFSGADDRILRRLEGTFEVEPTQEAPNAPDRVRVEFSFTLGDVNESQEISAPSGARPLSELLQQFGISGDAAGLLPGGGGAGAGGAPAPPSAGTSQQYLDCLSNAEGPEALQACQDLLEQ